MSKGLGRIQRECLRVGRWSACRALLFLVNDSWRPDAAGLTELAGESFACGLVR